MRITFVIVILSFLLSSCSTFLEEYSQDMSRVETVSDLDELLLGSAYHPVAYGYSYLNGSPYNSFVHFMSDELRHNSNADSYYNDWSTFTNMYGYYTWQRQVGLTLQGQTTGTELECWKMSYEHINVTNMLIDELDRVDAHDMQEAKDKVRIEGEAYFLRALYYFILVNLYAPPYAPETASNTSGIPLKLTPYVEDKEYEAATVSGVYKQIVDDLKHAEKCLLKSEHKSVYRADITATYLLMSRVYLYMQDYKNARTYAQYVLDRNDVLVDLNAFTGTDNVFTSESPEVIFSMGGHVLSYYLYGEENPRYTSANPWYISDELIAAFGNDDLRKTLYIANGDGGYVFKKIYWTPSVHDGEKCSVSDIFLFRTSEAYLNLAEAAAFDKDEETARRMIKTLQARRFSKVPEVTETGNALIDLIRKERQRELCLEGHRWSDLRRYTVCEAYPWSYAYRHIFTEFQMINYKQTAVASYTYELEANDPAYTLAYPEEVIEFQNTLSTNTRPEREPIEVNNLN